MIPDTQNTYDLHYTLCYIPPYSQKWLAMSNIMKFGPPYSKSTGVIVSEKKICSEAINKYISQDRALVCNTAAKNECSLSTQSNKSMKKLC